MEVCAYTLDLAGRTRVWVRLIAMPEGGIWGRSADQGVMLRLRDGLKLRFSQELVCELA